MSAVHRTFRRWALLVLVMMGGCDLFKTKYEDIPPPLPETVAVIDAANYSWQLRTLEGDTITLSRYAGKKMFINIWGSWCQPCLLELPHLQELYDAMQGDTTVAFVFVSDEPDSTVRAFVAENAYSLPFYVSDAAKPRPYNTGKYPTTIIVNSAGEIVYRLALTADWSDASAEEFIRNLD